MDTAEQNRRYFEALHLKWREAHMAGDVAAINARSARNRKAERHWQSANKSARALGTAIEATTFVVSILEKAHAGPETVARSLITADALLEDLAYRGRDLAGLHPAGADQKMTDPVRRLKEMLFEFVRAIEAGEIEAKDEWYGGVLISRDPDRFAYLRFSIEPKKET